MFTAKREKSTKKTTTKTPATTEMDITMIKIRNHATNALTIVKNAKKMMTTIKKTKKIKKIKKMKKINLNQNAQSVKIISF